MIMAKLNLDDFKQNAKRAVTDKPKVGGIFSEPNQRTFSLPLDSLFYRIKIRIGNPSLQTLTDAIDRFGQIEPIIVHKIDEGYEIINGHQRVLALSVLEKSNVVATLHDADDTEALFLPYLLNPAESFIPLEIANYLRVLTQDYALSEEIINKYTGLKSSQYASLQIDQDLISMFDEEPTYEQAMNKLNALYDNKLGRKYHLRGHGFKIDKNGKKFRIDADAGRFGIDDTTALHRLIDYFRLQEQ